MKNKRSKTWHYDSPAISIPKPGLRLELNYEGNVSMRQHMILSPKMQTSSKHIPDALDKMKASRKS